MNNLYYYTNEDYDCPDCGTDGNDCDPDPDNEYGLLCPNCGCSFETPDT
jgi:transcription elongation factor Elf1